MTPNWEREQNKGACRRLSRLIQQKYPFGRFLAIAGGKIIADAATFDELGGALRESDQDSEDVLVVQAGGRTS